MKHGARAAVPEPKPKPMGIMSAVVLTLRFLLELGALVALGWWGRGAVDGAASLALAVVTRRYEPAAAGASRPVR